MSGILRLNPSDNVAVVVAAGGIATGEVIDIAGVTARQDIATGHKVALASIAEGAPVVKFGHMIARATKPIAPGEWVHIHNVAMPDATDADEAPPHVAAQLPWAADAASTFQGYPRAAGWVGTRNYIAVAATVNCSATVVKAICRHFAEPAQKARLAEKNIDGVVPITHGMGCAQAIGGEGYAVLNKTLAGWVFHPNVVGALLIGLGCEGTTPNSVLGWARKMKLPMDIDTRSFSIQEMGGTTKAIAHGIAEVDGIVQALPDFVREPVSVRHLTVALNCGGSDGLSSITANPTLGLASDALVGKGGVVALAEIPECHGAEEFLESRAASADVKKHLADIFTWWRQYAASHGTELNDNLAPGNMAGGISTIVEKSLGAVAKAGGTALTAAVGYSEPIRTPGFTLMNTPGFDPVSVTGLVAGGCNLVVFTTGRGSVYGCSTVPTVKVATNSSLFQNMQGDMDFDAGRAIEMGTVPVSGELYALMIETASGQTTCSESLGLGWEEFVPWPVDATL